jgi:hypothetical protein
VQSKRGLRRSRLCSSSWTGSAAISRARHSASAGRLIVAIDDYIEQITGDRPKPHTPHHRQDEAAGEFANERQETATADYTTPPKSIPSLASASAFSADVVGFVSR